MVLCTICEWYDVYQQVHSSIIFIHLMRVSYIVGIVVVVLDVALVPKSLINKHMSFGLSSSQRCGQKTKQKLHS